MDIFETSWRNIEPGDGTDQSRDLADGGYIIASMGTWSYFNADDEVVAEGRAESMAANRGAAEAAVLAHFNAEAKAEADERLIDAS